MPGSDEIRVNPQTPLLSNKKIPNKKQRTASHLFAADFNAQTVFTYFVSANGFWKHLAESAYAPDFILNNKESFDHNITELSKPWQYGMLGSYVTGSAFLLIGNQMGMPTRVAQFFGWESASENNNTNPKYSCKNGSVLTASVISALWKTIVSSASLLVLFAPYLGFWAALGIAVAALPGNVLAQLSMFAEPFFKNLGALHLPDWLKAGIVIYLTLGYCLSNMALYWNTIDQGFQRLNWMKNRLLQIQSLPINIMVNSLHGITNLNFGVESYKRFSERISNLISKPQTQISYSTTTNTDIIITINSQSDNNANKLSFWSKTTVRAMAAAAYKTFAVGFAMLAMIALAMPLDNFSFPVISIIVLTLLATAFNFIPQLTLLNPPQKIEVDQQNKAITKVKDYIRHFTVCCPKGKTVSPRQLEEGQGLIFGRNEAPVPPPP